VIIQSAAPSKAALYDQDLALVSEINAHQSPSDDDITTIGRLFMRYQGSAGGEELKLLISRTVEQWGMDRQSILDRSKQLWQTGYRPGRVQDEITVGSGADQE
tara:strand:- start:1981 stop:2289 length:309 start_codon:yes stop_codon:yes gene_type:complete